MEEEIIKSKLRVQKHGEVFTPKRIVNKMLNIPEIKEACENLTATFKYTVTLSLSPLLKKKLLYNVLFEFDINSQLNFLPEYS